MHRHSIANIPPAITATTHHPPPFDRLSVWTTRLHSPSYIVIKRLSPSPMNARSMNKAIFFVHVLLVQSVVGFLNTIPASTIWQHDKKSYNLAPLFSSTSSVEIKTEKEINFIKRALLENSLFNGMPEENLLKMINACEKVQAVAGENIVTQGDSTEGGYVYLLAKGQCKVIIDGKDAPHPYGTIGEESLFGELGILYEQQRGATIQVDSDTATVYRILGTAFKSILNEPVENLATMEEIDNVINQISGTRSLYKGDIILPYKPERAFLWTQYTGTLLAFTSQITFIMMGVSAAFIVFAKDTDLGDGLANFKEIWEIQRNLATFVLAFFVNHGFSFWQSIYRLARKIQNNISSYCLMLATNVERDDNGELTEESIRLLEEIGQYVRLFHILMWASKAKRFSVLASPDGLKRMESRGLMTKPQWESLQSMDVPIEDLYHAPIEWMIIRSNQAMKEGVLAGDTATKGKLLGTASSIRMAAREISDDLSGRMPLAYVQLVQLLVDTFVVSAPFALYSKLQEESIIAVGLVTLFYTGLNNLAKIFLDPLNNEEYCENSIFMDLGVLIREVNSISTEYVKAGTRFPSSS